MNRRNLLGGILLSARLWAQEAVASLRGKLLAGAQLALPDGRKIALTGDEPTLGVLHDPRVHGMDFEFIGHPSGPSFVIDPIHKKAMYVHRNGERLFVTYWCDICSIRTYTPGQCWCCQEQTELDLRERYD